MPWLVCYGGVAPIVAMRNASSNRRDLTRKHCAVFQRTLLRWYNRYQRPLPWRRTRDPYKILVSEIMLQQTQVDRVIPKYQEFLRRYPSVKALARARISELRKVWYPLGYNIRPLRLRNIARAVMTCHGGQIPNSYDGLLAMEGIGRYTAGAVLSFAFNQDAPILDTNVARLLQRYFGISQGPTKSPAFGGAGITRRRLWKLASLVIPPGKADQINQAMMDFGATVCTARAPRCPTCPLRRTCQSFPFDPSTRPSASLRIVVSERSKSNHDGQTTLKARARRDRRH